MTNIYTGSEQRVVQMMGALATTGLQMAGRGGDPRAAIVIGVDAHLEGDGGIDDQLDQPAHNELQGGAAKEEKGRLENVAGEPGKDQFLANDISARDESIPMIRQRHTYRSP